MTNSPRLFAGLALILIPVSGLATGVWHFRLRGFTLDTAWMTVADALNREDAIRNRADIAQTGSVSRRRLFLPSESRLVERDLRPT